MEKFLSTTTAPLQIYLFPLAHEADLCWTTVPGTARMKYSFEELIVSKF